MTLQIARPLSGMSQIDCIVNCAAYTNVDAAESDEAAADRVNHIAVGYLAEVMNRVGGLLVHISTDYVFGGNVCNIPYIESSPTSPLGVYGRTKLAGEEAIGSIGCRNLIIRTAWMYSEFGKNFVRTIHSLASTRDNLRVVFDQVGTPTYAGDLARAIVDILESGRYEGNYGLYHFTNEGVCSWYDFAQAIVRLSGNTRCSVAPCHSSEFPSPVKRPSYSVLDKTKIKNTFGLSIPYWTDSLELCIKNLK